MRGFFSGNVRGAEQKPQKGGMCALTEMAKKASPKKTYCFFVFLFFFYGSFIQERVTSGLQNRDEHKEVMARPQTQAPTQ